MTPEVLNIGMLAILALLIFFMFRNGQKRKKQMEELRSKIMPGAEVMTNFGLFGTIVSIDLDTNKTVLETSPGVTIVLHSQAIARVVEDETALPAAPQTQLNEDNAEFVGEPEFGERTNDDRNPGDEPRPGDEPTGR